MSTASTASFTPPPATDACAICLADLPSSSSPSPDNATCWLEPCCHAYHYACLLRWVAAARPPRCPLCTVSAVAALVPVGGGRHVRHALAGGGADVTPLPAGVRRRAAALAAGDAPLVEVPAATLATRAARQAAHDWVARDLAALSGGVDAGVAALAVAAAATRAREGDATAWRAYVAAAAHPFVGDSVVAASLAAWAAAFVASGMSVTAWDRVHGGGGGGGSDDDDDQARRQPTARAASLSPSSMGRANSLTSDGSDAYGGAVEAAGRPG